MILLIILTGWNTSITIIIRIKQMKRKPSRIDSKCYMEPPVPDRQSAEDFGVTDLVRAVNYSATIPYIDTAPPAPPPVQMMTARSLERTNNGVFSGS